MQRLLLAPLPLCSIAHKEVRKYMWTGQFSFLLGNLILKDFRVRYRNASLGVLWSILNPIVMMSVFWFVFTRIFTNSIPHFPVFLLCGMVPFNFFSLAWGTGTVSLVENTGLVKRVPIPREIIPISSVLGNCLHLLIQIALLLALVLGSGLGFNVYWAWLPVIWALEIMFVCGLALIFSVVNVYVRDTRYVVESACTVLMWLVPIFYPFSMVPPNFRELYQLNPVAALVLAMRNILLEGKAPPTTLLWKLALVASISLLAGFVVFRALRKRVYDSL